MLIFHISRFLLQKTPSQAGVDKQWAVLSVLTGQSNCPFMEQSRYVVLEQYLVQQSFYKNTIK